MRVALLSDLHANELALEAVVADVRRVGADQIVCLGDVATLGPRPSSVIARLRDLGCACILGNHDEFLLDATLLRHYTEAPVVVDSVNWCRSQLSDDELGFLRGFGRTLEVSLEGGATPFLFHGSPRSHMDDIIAQTPAELLDQMLDGRQGTVMAGGHTHVQMLRQHRGILLVNPGSVGMPFKEYVGGRAPKVMAHAEYAVVESTGSGVAVTLRRVELDRKALRSAVQDSELPLAAALAEEYA